MKTYVIGDIHGAYKALKQCLEESPITREDRLIVIGDVVDGYSQTAEVVEELLNYNTIKIQGNHDYWFYRYLRFGSAPEIWLSQGGLATLRSYGENEQLKVRHLDKYFAGMIPFYLDSENRLFVHGGINPHKKLQDQDEDDVMWDRNLFFNAANLDIEYPEYNKIFVGHTDVRAVDPDSFDPFIGKNLINVDTGAGWQGKLTIMDVDTLEYWQSDRTKKLYPKEQRR